MFQTSVLNNFLKRHFLPECQFSALCLIYKYCAVIFVKIQAYLLGPSRAQIIPSFMYIVRFC